MNVPPLSEALPGLPTPIFSSAKIEDQVTQISTLSNGIRVASEQGFGQFCTVGGETLFCKKPKKGNMQSQY